MTKKNWLMKRQSPRSLRGFHVPVELVAVCAAVLIGAFLVLRVHPAPVDTVLATYGTELADRTPHQQYNARRAAAAVDGTVVPAGEMFSFNDILHGWTADQGFLKAPVSYDGVLIDDYGGGVCETSTTLYNAALIAGLKIVERHPHSFAPSYAPAGRDAAVAYPSADLKFVNTSTQPITIHIRPWGHRLVCRFQALPVAATRDRVVVRSEVLGRRSPSDAPALPGAGMRRSRWHLRGRDGLRVAVFRTWYRGDEPSRSEQVSDDTYLPISRVSWGG